MSSFLTLVIWLLAAVWTASSHSFWIMGLLIGLAVVQLVDTWRKQKYPRSWQWTLLGLQVAWLVAAYWTTEPYLLAGLFIQWVGMKVMARPLQIAKEKQAVWQNSYDQQAALLNELRHQRHDLHKHLTAIQYASSGSVYTYEESLQNRHAEIDHVLRSEINVVAGALYAYQQQAKEKELSLYYHIQQAISGLPLPEHELVSLLSNMLCNALEAAEQYQLQTQNKARVQLTCRKQSGIWVIVCQNHTIPLANETIERIYTKRAISTKGGSHEGLGTQQIQRIVTQASGNLDFIAKGEQFTLKIKIPDIQSSHSNE
ncbi:hypothetical protein CEW92_11630 [Bacillaceae bacterium SAS-127]|nr:hypothetical protein CEW92_11630 [Bacillaceae bacterium SAS-127]